MDKTYTIANGIWQKLGAQRFSMLTGCKPLVYGDVDGRVFLQMKVGKNQHNVNRLEVLYDDNKDLYELHFIKKYGVESHVTASYKEVSFDSMKTLFKQHTGMSVELPKIAC